MAFSLRKMLSNITYFKKPGEDERIAEPESDHDLKRFDTFVPPEGESTEIINLDFTEPDSTSKQYATSMNLPDTIKTFSVKKGSLSDTDLLKNFDMKSKKEKRTMRKLKLDVKKANQSLDEGMNREDNIENTPKHILLECKSSEAFSERIKLFDFKRSFDLFEAMSDDQLSCQSEEGNLDVESLSDSDTNISLQSNEEDTEVKMCRKVSDTESIFSSEGTKLVPSASLESFGDVEVDRNEEERLNLLLSYEMKLEKIECFLKKIFTEFQFHIEVSKVFQCRSIVTTLPSTDVRPVSKILGDVTCVDNINRGVSPTGSWNLILEKEDNNTKLAIRKQLLSIRNCIDEFVNVYLNQEEPEGRKKKMLSLQRSATFDVPNGKCVSKKRLHVSNKKKAKCYDFPDIREVMINLFSPDTVKEDCLSVNSTSNLSDFDESDTCKCSCRCHIHSTSSQTDSGLTSKTDERSMSITSSIGNFILDSSTLTAYSDTLDQIISYNSFEDTSLYSTLLQKAAIERITFYVQVHSIQLKCELIDQDYESKNVITFHCPSCKTTEKEENDLLKHILSQYHCEKIHFLYKTAYIKQCVELGKEIQPSTVLNPMKMYRDENKIVCFGDARYACSLCFENFIVGESVLMAHCSETEHLERKEKLIDIVG